MACIWTLNMVDGFYHKTLHQQEIQAVKNPTTVLGNLLSHFPRSEFEKSVQEQGGDHRTRTLGCFDLLKTLAYGQITGAFSVREIESALNAHSARLYHCGMKPVKRTTLCDALGRRDPVIFERTFNALVAKAQILSSKSQIRFRNPMRLIDASTIELCLARFNWAKFRSTKGAVKIHVALDGDHFFPSQVQMTTGAVHEVNQMAELSQGEGIMHVYDRGYVDFKRLWDINLAGSFFVTRMKQNCQFDLVRPISCSADAPVRFDSIIRLSSEKAKNDYPDTLRQVTYHDAETDREYVFITNDHVLSAQEIADTYKTRWQVELFFKWIKQNLKIKTFWGTSRNAVFTQIWVALIVFMLLWISKHVDGLSESPQRVLQLLKTSLLEKRTLSDLLQGPEPPTRLDPGQLLFSKMRSA